MEELLVIAAVILYFVVTAAAHKNKKNKKTQKHDARTRKAQFDQAFEQISAENMTGESMEGKGLPVYAKQGTQTIGQEAPNPCHFGSALSEEAGLEDSPFDRSPIFHPEDQDAFAQDVLRGVVMSEVLNRPSRHGLGGRMKRRT